MKRLPPDTNGLIIIIIEGLSLLQSIPPNKRIGLPVLLIYDGLSDVSCEPGLACHEL